MNMFKPTKAKTMAEYIAAASDDRREMLVAVDQLIRKTAPQLKPHFAANMLGYGSFPYRNYKHELIEWPTIALANQKQYISLYVCAVRDGQYLAEEYADRLGAVSVGKSCIRFKKLTEVNLPALVEVIKLAARFPGLAGVGEHRKK